VSQIAESNDVPKATPNSTSEVEQPTPEDESRYQYYTGNQIPWFVRLMWLAFWCFAAYYTVRYFFPAVQREMVTPP
jgi:hypothetical protein